MAVLERMKKTARGAVRGAALGTALCLAGCAAGSRNMTLEAKEKPEGVVELGDRYVSIGCGHTENEAQSYGFAPFNARKQLGEFLGKKGQPTTQEHLMARAKLLRMYRNEKGHTCVELELPK